MGQKNRPDDRRVAGSRLPPTANLLSKGITKRLNPESQNARKSRPAPGFLAKSNTCSRQITAINQQLPNTSRTTKLTELDIRREPSKGRFCEESGHKNNEEGCEKI